MYGLSHTIVTVVVNHWRHDAAVGGAVASCFAEMDVARLVGIVCDYQNVILSRLCVAGDHTGFRGIAAIATGNHFVRGKPLGTGTFGIVERSPTTEVDVNTGSAVHVNVDITRSSYSHEVPCGIWGGVKAVVVGTILATSCIHACGELVHAVIGAEWVGSVAKVVLP